MVGDCGRFSSHCLESSLRKSSGYAWHLHLFLSFSPAIGRLRIQGSELAGPKTLPLKTLPKVQASGFEGKANPFFWPMANLRILIPHSITCANPDSPLSFPWFVKQSRGLQLYFSLKRKRVFVLLRGLLRLVTGVVSRQFRFQLWRSELQSQRFHYTTYYVYVKHSYFYFLLSHGQRWRSGFPFSRQHRGNSMSETCTQQYNNESSSGTPHTQMVRAFELHANQPFKVAKHNPQRNNPLDAFFWTNEYRT